MAIITREYNIDEIETKILEKEKIGGGSYGEVFKMSENKALKVFLCEKRPLVEKIQRLTDMNLPNLVKLLKIYPLSCFNKLVLCYEMNLIKGLEIEDYFINIDLQTKLKLLHELKDIILEYHKRKVSIIDLRSPNILINKQAQITLIDIDNMSYNDENVEVTDNALGYLHAGGKLNNNYDIYAYNILAYYLLEYTKHIKDIELEKKWLKYYKADDYCKLDSMFDHEWVIDYIKIKR